MILHYQTHDVLSIDSEEMVCDEAELGPDEFAEKMQNQTNLQEQVHAVKLPYGLILVELFLTLFVFTATGDVKAHASISLRRPICNS